MPSKLSALGIDRLPREERLTLVQEIWDSIAAEQPPLELSLALRAELDRRVVEDDAAPDQVVPWEQVKMKAFQKP